MNKKNIAFLWGSGAVCNSWLPILNSIKPYHLKKDLSIDGANTLLALLVYNMRHHAQIIGTRQGKVFERAMEILKNTRSSICQQIKYYQESGQMKIHKEFNDIVQRIILPNCGRLLLVTTNWDTIVDDALFTNVDIKRFINSALFCTHLHGNYNDPDTLYLPTEVVNERYRLKSRSLILAETMLQ